MPHPGHSPEFAASAPHAGRSSRQGHPAALLRRLMVRRRYIHARHLSDHTLKDIGLMPDSPFL